MTDAAHEITTKAETETRRARRRKLSRGAPLEDGCPRSERRHSRRR